MESSIRTFWKRRAERSESSIRWSSSAMLRTDVEILRRYRRNDRPLNWLDVGCGSGDLQRALRGEYDFCLGLDAEMEMQRMFPTDGRTAFLRASAGELLGRAQFDLVTAFGLVTSLDRSEEVSLYRFLAEMTAPEGTCIVKNQVSQGSEVVINKFSTALEDTYWGRYPSRSQQEADLEEVFGVVRFVPYPSHLNTNDGMIHGAFVCRMVSHPRR